MYSYIQYVSTSTSMYIQKLASGPMLSHEQMSRGWPLSILNDEQTSNWLRVVLETSPFSCTLEFWEPPKVKELQECAFHHLI